MKHLSSFRLAVIGVVVFGAMLRLVGFPHVPPELNRDEAALGYNAFAIFAEGRDEWGISLPLVFRSFGDMKLPGYIYILAPFVGGLGLQNWVVRLPSFLAGVGLIFLVIRLGMLLGLTRKGSWFAGLVVAVSPWAMHYGTTAFEANLALAFFLLFLIFLLTSYKGIRTVCAAGIFLLLTLLTYNAPLVLTPFILVFAVISKTTTIRKGIFLGLIVIAAFVLTAPASRGKTNIGLWTNPEVVERVNQLRVKDGEALLGRIIHRPIIAVIPQIIHNHIQAYSWNFLVNGVMSNPWHTVAQLGFLTQEVYTLAAIGTMGCCVVLIRGGRLKSQSSRGMLWLAFLLLIAPLPASLTRDAPHATRSLLLFISSALAAAWAVDRIFNALQKIGSTSVSFLLLLFALGFCARGIHIAQARASVPPAGFNSEWWVGSRKAFAESASVSETIGVIGDVHYAYMYPLFFERYLPSQLLSVMRRGPIDSSGFSDVQQLGRYVFFSSVRDIPPEVRYYIEQTAPGQFELKKK